MSTPAPDLAGPMDRRTFLGATAGGAAALALASLLPAGCGGYPAVANLRTFTAKEFAVLQALVDTVVPAGGGNVSAHEIDVAGYLDNAFHALPALMRKQLKQALLLLEYGGLWYGPERRRLTRMSAAARETYVGGWLDSPAPFRRQVGQTFRRAIINAYYSDERAWRAIGYDGPFVEADTPASPPRRSG